MPAVSRNGRLPCCPTLAACPPVQVVVGCAKPRFFVQQSNLFEVHTEVRAGPAAACTHARIVAAACAFAHSRLRICSRQHAMPAGARSPAVPLGPLRPSLLADAHAADGTMPATHARASFTAASLVASLPSHCPQTGMLWNTEGGSPMVPIGEEDLPSPILVRRRLQQNPLGN